MIQALSAYSNIKKFTMLRYHAHHPVDYSNVYEDEAAVANHYFNRVPHLEEIGICNAHSFGGSPHMHDTGKVFVRIRTEVEATNPVGNEEHKELNNGKVEEIDNTSNTDRTNDTGKTDGTEKVDKNDKKGKTPAATAREIRKVLRIYQNHQSDEYRIMQLEKGRIAATPDRNPRPVGVYRDPEYSMFELEWKWARHQTLKPVLEAEKEAKRAAEAADAPAVAAALENNVAAPPPLGSPAWSNISIAGSSPPLSVAQDVPAAAAAAPPHVDSVFGGAPAVANVSPVLEDAASQSIADANGGSGPSTST